MSVYDIPYPLLIVGLTLVAILIFVVIFQATTRGAKQSAQRGAKLLKQCRLCGGDLEPGTQPIGRFFRGASQQYVVPVRCVRCGHVELFTKTP